MALITTTKSLGWYGVHGASECSSLSLPAYFGTYNSSGVFQVGESGLTESESRGLKIWTMTPNGNAWPWDTKMEKQYRNSMPALLADLEALECGQMYWISWNGRDLNIPGFVPTAKGVDMGRISA
tara:strand:+ start:137 stop:511 length:375 start_codon:yes stop_codon:yes gene_type:complete